MQKHCCICGNALTESQIKRGVTTCCKSCSSKKAWQNANKRKQELRERNALRWSNEESRNKTIQNMKKTWSSQEKRQEQSIALKKAYQNEELLKKISECSLRAHKNPEIELKRSKSLKATFALPEQKAKRSKNSSISRKQFWSSITKEQKELTCKAMSENKLKIIRNLTEEQRKERHERQSRAVAKALANMPEEQKLKIIQKRSETMKKNGTASTSSWEENSFIELCKVFNESDIERQYFDRDRYPFKCDFYIKSLDLFIECHYDYRHCPKYGPFDKNNKEHLAHVEELTRKIDSTKKNDNYERSIYVWTDLDVRKRQCAEKNKLNWLCFYHPDKFKAWLMKGDKQLCQFFI